MSLYRTQSEKLIFIAATAVVGIFTIKLIVNKLRNREKQKEKCIIIRSAKDWYDNEDEILKTINESGVLGMDCEWVTDGKTRKPISLLQLANINGFCVLIRLSFIPVWQMPIGLSELLKDRNILKVGVGITEDATKLFNDYCIEVQNFLDLRHLAKDLHELKGKPLGLKSLAKELLNYDLDKSFTLRCSDWDAENLSDEQIKYAADDAVISAKLFENIKYRTMSWLGFASRFNEDVEIYVDVPFKQKSNNGSKNRCRSSIMKFKTRYSKPRQRQLYDNCQLVAPDGEVLCNCERRRVEWYINTGLGECISEEPFIVKLNFEPSGRPRSDDIFYTIEKVNCCVVCGKTQNYHRKLVVPAEYRKYFPALMKKKLSHDVLLLCVDCHKRSNILDHKMRLKLVELCDAPLTSSQNIKFKLNSKIAQVKSAASALSKSSEKIPIARKEFLEKIIMNYYNIPEVTKQVLEEACNLDVNIFNESYVSHGMKVYQYFCENGGLIQLEKMWRQHFLDIMQPKFLPAMWSVEHNHKRLAEQIINHKREVNFDVSILGLDLDMSKEVEVEKE